MKVNLSGITRSAIREIPKTWQSLNKTYLQPITRKDIFFTNLVAALVGLICGYGAIGFRYLIGLLQNLFLHDQFDWQLISPVGNVRGPWMFVILPIGLLASALLTRYLSRESEGHGVPEVIEAVMTRGGRMKKRVVLVKALASSITIASGGSVGREGPIVQIGAAAGSAIGQLLRLDPKLLKTLVGCGAAGAIAATFNTPIAGVIFAIEIIVLELKTKSFVPLVITSVFATVVSRFHLGNEPAFIVPHYKMSGPNELIFYLGLGVLSGILGVLVIKSLYWFEDFFTNLAIPFWLKPIVGGILVVSVGSFFPEMYGVGYESISQVLLQESTWQQMALFVLIKMFCTNVTLASGGSGGVFVPSLFIGAMFGGAYGSLVNWMSPELSSGFGPYALVGMAAVFSATSRATFTAIVILFEMTLDYSLILPLMFVCVLADQTAWAILPDSIYSMKLKRRGLKFINDIGVNVMSITLVRDIMTTEICVAAESMMLQDAALRFQNHDHTIYPVVDHDGRLRGVVSKTKVEKLRQKHPKMPIHEVMEPALAIVRPDDTVFKAIAKIEKTRDPRILVVDPNSKKLIGIVSPIDFVRLSSAAAD